MPTQNFSLNEATAALAAVQWAADYSTIDLTYNGTLLTRITDAQSLRTTGLQGQAADGATLVLRLEPGLSGEQFTLERNGARMHPGPVDFATLSPTAAIHYGTTGSGIGPSAPQEKVMRSARRWIRALGILATLGGASVLVLSFADTVAYGSTENAVKLGDKYYVASSLRGIAIGLVVFGLLIVLIGSFAKGARAKLMFGIAMVLFFLLALVNLLGGSPISAVIPAAAGARSLQAWKVAKSLGNTSAR